MASYCSHDKCSAIGLGNHSSLLLSTYWAPGPVLSNAEDTAGVKTDLIPAHGVPRQWIQNTRIPVSFYEKHVLKVKLQCVRSVTRGLVLSGGATQKITQIREEDLIRAKSHKQIKWPTTGGACQATPACPLSLRRITFRLQSSGDKRLEDRVPGSEPGTEPGDGITHTTHRSVCIWKARGQGAEKQRGGQSASRGSL